MLETDSHAPLYIKIERDLRENLIERKLSPGDALPSEQELCDKYKVSRVTIRHALARLRHDGLVEGFRGRGTFVSHPKVGHPMAAVCSLEERMAARGLTVRHKFLSFSVMKRATGWASQALHLPPAKSSVYRLKRLRTVEGKCLGLEEHFFPIDLAVQLDPARLKAEPVLSLVQDTREPASRISRVRLTTSCGFPSGVEARKLAIPDGYPVLIRHHTYFTDANEPIFCGRNLFRDWYQFTLDMEQLPTGQVVLREWD